MTYTRLPRSLPKSLRYAPKEPPSPLAKARVHERRAEKIRDDDEGKPHLQFLERWKAVEAAVEAIEAKAKKELAYKLGKEEVRIHELFGHLLTEIPRARQERLFALESIRELNLLISKRSPQRLVDKNEMLQDLGVTHKDFVRARQDLRFHLGLQGYKSAQAIALLLLIVRAACDPKVRKEVSLVKDEEVLASANALLREITTHVIGHMQAGHDRFFEVEGRKKPGPPPGGRKA